MPGRFQGFDRLGWARCRRTLGLEPPGPEVGGKAADPTDLISPTLGCALACASVRLVIFVLIEFQLAFLSAAKVNRLNSFSSTPSDWREVSVSPVKAAGVRWVLYLHHESALSDNS